MIEISKELLSEVLGHKAYLVKKEHIKWDTNPRDNDLVYERENELQYCIDRDNLAHKCKKWALGKGYRLLSGYDELEYENSDINDATVIINHIYCEGGCRCEKSFISGTEVEAIFEACEWILKEIKK